MDARRRPLAQVVGKGVDRKEVMGARDVGRVWGWGRGEEGGKSKVSGWHNSPFT